MSEGSTSSPTLVEHNTNANKNCMDSLPYLATHSRVENDAALMTRGHLLATHSP